MCNAFRESKYSSDDKKIPNPEMRKGQQRKGIGPECSQSFLAPATFQIKLGREDQACNLWWHRATILFGRHIEALDATHYQANAAESCEEEIVSLWISILDDCCIIFKGANHKLYLWNPFTIIIGVKNKLRHLRNFPQKKNIRIFNSRKG